MIIYFTAFAIKFVAIFCHLVMAFLASANTIIIPNVSMFVIGRHTQELLYAYYK
jgi:hypothetical protein